MSDSSNHIPKDAGFTDFFVTMRVWSPDSMASGDMGTQEGFALSSIVAASTWHDVPGNAQEIGYI